jgi:hypothetical protein
VKQKEEEDEREPYFPRYGAVLREAFERLRIRKGKRVKKLALKKACGLLDMSYHTLLRIFRGEYDDRYFPAVYLDVESRATEEEKKEELLKLYEAKKRDFERHGRRLFPSLTHIFAGAHFQ